MEKRSTGVKRIVVILSVVSTIIWVSVIGVGMGIVGEEEWFFFVVGIVVAYFVPQLISKLVYWVLDGFKKDKET